MSRRFLGHSEVIKNLSFILGFRPDYKLENILITISAFISALMYIIIGANIISTVIVSILVLGPLLLQFNTYRKKFRSKIQLPLYVVLMSGVISLFIPLVAISAIANALFIEDFTVFFTFDVANMKRTVRVFIAPVARKELFVLLIGTLFPSIATFLITHTFLVFVYPVIAYVMIAYSLILVPPQYHPPERGRNILEEVSRRVSMLYFMFNRLYMTPQMRRLGKEGGMFGHEYEVYIRKMAGLFTLSLYFGLAISPLIGLLIGPIGFFVPPLFALIILGAPYFSLSSRKRARAGYISRNQLLILSYLASMKAVSESFTNLMFNLYDNPKLAKLFGLDQESKLYHQIYMANGIETVSVREYADSIPDDYYRDTVRTMMDIEENEGMGATFRMLIGRLRDYTGRYIDRTSTMFENIGSNIISVIMLVETAMPIMMFLSAPQMLPLIMLTGGILSVVMMYSIASGTLPDLPSEFIYTKPRYRKGAIIFTLLSLMLILIERILTPNLLMYEFMLNVPVAFWGAWWYINNKDLTINNMLLDKFSDLLVLFSSSLSRYNSVERALLDLSQQPTFPLQLRNEFIRLARIFTYLNVQKLQYKGPYWYKYLMFLVSISSVYGVSPRDLYKTISNFMLEFKRFFSLVKGFGTTMLLMGFIALLIMTMEMNISFEFLQMTHNMNINKASQGMGIQSPFPQMSQQEINRLTLLTNIALLATAIMNGIGVAKIISGTVRDGKYVIGMFILELILIYVGATTHFGINIKISH